MDNHKATLIDRLFSLLGYESQTYIRRNYIPRTEHEQQIAKMSRNMADLAGAVESCEEQEKKRIKEIQHMQQTAKNKNRQLSELEESLKAANHRITSLEAACADSGMDNETLQKNLGRYMAAVAEQYSIIADFFNAVKEFSAYVPEELRKRVVLTSPEEQRSSGYDITHALKDMRDTTISALTYLLGLNDGLSQDIARLKKVNRDIAAKIGLSNPHDAETIAQYEAKMRDYEAVISDYQAKITDMEEGLGEFIHEHEIENLGLKKQVASLQEQVTRLKYSIADLHKENIELLRRL